MTRCRTVCLAIALICAAAPVFGQSKAKAENVPEIPYDSVPNFFKMPPTIYFGEGIGIATNSKGHVFVYTRSGDTRLFEFDEKGNFVRELGQGLYGFVFAHAVRVDKDDNIWAVDEGANMVIKFNPQGRVVLTLGRRPEAVEGSTQCRDRASTAARTSRIVQPADRRRLGCRRQHLRLRRLHRFARGEHAKNGRFIKSAGTRGNQPGQLNLPHTLQVDLQGNVYIGDRSNARVQVWDNDLNPKAIYDNVGSPWTLCISPGPHQYLFVSNSVPDNGDSRTAAVTGEIYKMELDGKILGKFGKGGKALKEFSTVHGIDCRNPNELYVSEITSWRAQKIILRPQTTTSSGK
jgi:hypothetical protein